MSRRIDLSYHMFGHLLCLGYAGKGKWLCRCSCSNLVSVSGQSLRDGHTKSCGCYRKAMTRTLAERREDNATHGHTRVGKRSRTYETWASMIKRCTNPNHERYKDYGGRGIAVCERWLTFENFLADMGERPADRTLDRRDNDKDYSPDNCRWATQEEQSDNKRNTRMFDGKSLRAWASEYGVCRNTIMWRLKRYGSVHLPTK